MYGTIRALFTNYQQKLHIKSLSFSSDISESGAKVIDKRITNDRATKATENAYAGVDETHNSETAGHVFRDFVAGMKTVAATTTLRLGGACASIKPGWWQLDLRR